MNGYNFFRNYQRLQVFFTSGSVIEKGFASLVLCDDTDNFYWNYALVKKNLTTLEISEIESFYSKIGKNNSFMLCEEWNSELIDNLKKKSYQKKASLDWFFYKKNKIFDFGNYEIKKVETELEMDEFASVLKDSFYDGDPQNSSGSLGETYLRVIKRVWKNSDPVDRPSHFLLYFKGQAVAASSLLSLGGIGYLSDICSVRRLRGQGFGKAITFFSINESIRVGNENHCLMTIHEGYASKFYKNLGLERSLVMDQYVLNK